MPKFCDKCGNELKNENLKFCDKCGAQLKKPNTNQSNNLNQNMVLQTKEKSMAVALIISFFFSGLGMAYAGNLAKGITYFLITLCLGFFLSLFLRSWLVTLIVFIFWIVGFILTYKEVNSVNNRNKMMFMNNY